MFDLQSKIYWQKCQSCLTERHLRWRASSERTQSPPRLCQRPLLNVVTPHSVLYEGCCQAREEVTHVWQEAASGTRQVSPSLTLLHCLSRSSTSWNSFERKGTRMYYFTEDINQLHCSLGCFHLLNTLKSIGSQFTKVTCLSIKFSHLSFWQFWTHVCLSDRSWCSLMEMRTVPFSSVFLLSTPWHSRTVSPPPTSARTSPALFQ